MDAHRSTSLRGRGIYDLLIKRSTGVDGTVPTQLLVPGRDLPQDASELYRGGAGDVVAAVE
jgi:hypothetical protein